MTTPAMVTCPKNIGRSYSLQSAKDAELFAEQYLLEIEFAESHNLCSEVLDQVIVKQIVYIRGT